MYIKTTITFTEASYGWALDTFKFSIGTGTAWASFGLRVSGS